MTKRRLADVLREEAQKPSNSEGNDMAETNSKQPLELGTAPSKTESAQETPQPSGSGANSTASRARRTGPTKAELEATVTELKEALQAAHQTETSLQEQVASLEAVLSDQKELVQGLQAELKQVGQVKGELQQAKEMILQLSKTNAVAPPAPHELHTRQEQPHELHTRQEQGDESLRFQKLNLKKLPHHSIHPKPAAPGPSTTIDTGWVD
jgi:chromosome segregation ATPase